VGGSGDRWRWTDQYGNQRLVHQDELRAALAGGTLPPYTLVWRPGMAEWCHANDVPELMAVALSVQHGVVLNIPPPPLDVVAVQAEFEHRTVDVARDGEKVAAEVPPPPPLELYAPHLARTSVPPLPAARAAAASGEVPAEDEGDAKTRVVEPAVAAAAAPPTPGPASATSANESEPQHAPGAEPHPIRVASLPAIRAAHHVSPPPLSRKSLKPSAAAAVPLSLPPPAASSREGGLVDPGVSEEGPASWGASPDPRGRLPPAPLLPSSDLLGVARDVEIVRERLPDEELPSFPLESEASSFASAARTLRAVASRISADVVRRAGEVGKRLAPALGEATGKLRDPKARLAVGVGALLPLAFVVLVVVVVRRCGSDDAEEKAPPRSGSFAAPVASVAPSDRAVSAQPAATARAEQTACAISKEATRLAPRASRDVPIEVAISRTDHRAFVGFAGDPKSALGLSLDASTLVAKPAFSARPAGKLLGVVPIAGSMGTAFAVDVEAEGDRLQARRTAAGDPPAIVGYALGGVAVASGASEEPRILWPLEGDQPVEALRLADLSDQGHAFAFRRRGEIFAGLLDRAHGALGPLTRVVGAGAPAGAPVGAPAIAYNGRVVAVAFADRVAAADPWEVRVGVGTARDLLPLRTTRFQIPSGGAGAGAMAPALAGLADGKWLLVWTEGTGANHDVRGQTLGPDLTPIGSPFTVSRPASNAGQAAVAVESGSAIVAYLLQAGDGYELWAAALSCR
jgi:hypothetical protein